MSTSTLDSNTYYIYPMANSLRGGATASESNIRNLFGVLLSKSSAKTTDDFKPKMDDSTDWYKNISIEGSTLTIDFEISIGPGKGNCNGYYVDLTAEKTPFSFTGNFTLPQSGDAQFDLLVYLRIIYSGTGICDGLYLWAGTDTDVENEYETVKSYGFYDIGILLGTIHVDASEPVVEYINNHCYYNYNDNITNCIDVNRLGNASGNFTTQLYGTLNNLFQLMIDNGLMTVGTVLNNKAINVRGNYVKFDPTPGTLGFNNKDELISKNKVQLYIEPTTLHIESEDVFYNYQNGNETSTKYNLKGSQIIPDSIVMYDDNRAVTVTYNDDKSIAYFDGGVGRIDLFTGAITWNDQLSSSYFYNISYDYNEEGYYTGGLQYALYDTSSKAFSDVFEILKFNSENVTVEQNIISQIKSVELLNSNFVFEEDKFYATSVAIKDPISNNKILLISDDNKLNIVKQILTFKTYGELENYTELNYGNISDGFPVKILNDEQSPDNRTTYYIWDSNHEEWDSSDSAVENTSLFCSTINANDINVSGTIIADRVIGAIWQ